MKPVPPRSPLAGAPAPLSGLPAGWPTPQVANGTYTGLNCGYEIPEQNDGGGRDIVNEVPSAALTEPPRTAPVGAGAA